MANKALQHGMLPETLVDSFTSSLRAMVQGYTGESARFVRIVG